jgi:hypothetical protein
MAEKTKNTVFVPNEPVCSPEFGADGCILPEDPSEEARQASNPE